MEPLHIQTVLPSLASIRMVATDLDGTLLRSDKTISKRTSSVLGRIQAAGVTLVLVSARPPRVLREFARAAGVGGLAICCNGAIVYDLDQDCALQQHALSSEQLTALITRLRAEMPGLSFGGEDGLGVACEASFLAHASSDTVPPQIVDIAAICQMPLVKLLVRHTTLADSELYERILALLDARTYSVTYSGAPFVEISTGGVEKGEALATLCARLGIASREVVAFGDMPNDLPLLSWAGTGIAVANAHPRVLQVADALTLTNDEDGVAHMLEHLLNDHIVRS